RLERVRFWIRDWSAGDALPQARPWPGRAPDDAHRWNPKGFKLLAEATPRGASLSGRERQGGLLGCVMPTRRRPDEENAMRKHIFLASCLALLALGITGCALSADDSTASDNTASNESTEPSAEAVGVSAGWCHSGPCSSFTDLKATISIDQ